MKKSSSLLTLGLFGFLAACSVSSSPQNEINGFGKDGTYGIYNGEVASSRTTIFKSTVYIQWQDSKNQNYVCTGTVLSPEVVLTAAHCLIEGKRLQDGSWVVPPQNIQIVDKNQEKILVQKVVVNPGYIMQMEYFEKHKTGDTLYQGYDIGLLKLKTPLSDFYQPVEIATQIKNVFSEETFIAGFGSFNNRKDNEIDGQLRRGPVTLSPEDRFIDVLTKVSAKQNFNIVTNTSESRLIQFNKSAKGSSICHGDSGGPLYYERKGKIYQIGVINEMDLGFKDKNCASNVKQTQTATFLTGPGLFFVAETFKKMTGKDLLEKPVLSPREDKKHFAYHFVNETEKLKDPFLDLTNSVFAVFTPPPPLDEHVMATIVSLDKINDACSIKHSDVLEVMSHSRKDFNGQEPLKLVHKIMSEPKSSFEVRIKDEKSHFQIVILTPDGYLSAKLPVYVCK